MMNELHRRNTYRGIVQSVTGGLEFTVDHINDSLGNILLKAAPIIAPIPSAVAVFNALLKADYAIWQAAIVAVVVEGLGYAAADLALKVWDHNQRSERHIKQWLPNSMFALYFIATLTTIFGFESAPYIIRWWAGQLAAWELAKHITPLTYPFLTIVGAVLFALRDLIDSHKRQSAKVETIEDEERERQRQRDDELFALEVEEKRKEAEEKRKLRRMRTEAKLSSQVSRDVSTEQPKRTVQPEKSVNPTDDEQLLEKLRTLVQQQLSSDGKLNKSRLAAEIDVSRTTLYRMLDAIPEHQPAYTNGHGPH